MAAQENAHKDALCTQQLSKESGWAERLFRCMQCSAGTETITVESGENKKNGWRALFARFLAFNAFRFVLVVISKADFMWHIHVHLELVGCISSCDSGLFPLLFKIPLDLSQRPPQGFGFILCKVASTASRKGLSGERRLFCTISAGRAVVMAPLSLATNDAADRAATGESNKIISLFSRCLPELKGNALYVCLI